MRPQSEPFWLKSISTDFGLLPRCVGPVRFGPRPTHSIASDRDLRMAKSSSTRSRQAQPWMLDGGIWCKKAEIREPRSSCAVEVVCNEMKRDAALLAAFASAAPPGAPGCGPAHRVLCLAGPSAAFSRCCLRSLPRVLRCGCDVHPSLCCDLGLGLDGVLCAHCSAYRT